MYGFDFFHVSYSIISFPSGHSATVFAVGTVFAMLLPRGKWLFYAVAGVVAFSRVVITKHYFSDMIIGSLIGYLTAEYLGEKIFSSLNRSGRPFMKDWFSAPAGGHTKQIGSDPDTRGEKDEPHCKTAGQNC
jgi:hypothetical protein